MCENWNGPIRRSTQWTPHPHKNFKKEMVYLDQFPENKLYAHYTNCDSTQPVACIRGYEPSGGSHRAVWLWGFIQATFQAQRQMPHSSTCNRYKMQYNGIIFVTSNVNNNTSDAKYESITEFPTNAARRAKQDTKQGGLSSKSSHSSCLGCQR